MDVGTSLNPAIDIGQVRVKYLIAGNCSLCFCCIDSKMLGMLGMLRKVYRQHSGKIEWNIKKKIREGFFSGCQYFTGVLMLCVGVPLFIQIEGAFVQGLGLYTLEEVRFSQTSSSWTTGPGVDKIPGFADIPLEFNVHLLRSAPNENAIYSSRVQQRSCFALF